MRAVVSESFWEVWISVIKKVCSLSSESFAKVLAPWKPDISLHTAVQVQQTASVRQYFPPLSLWESKPLMAGSPLSLRRAKKQGNCEDQDSFLLHGLKKAYGLFTAFVDLSGRAVPSILGCPQGILPRNICKPGSYCFCSPWSKRSGQAGPGQQHMLSQPFPCIQ